MSSGLPRLVVLGSSLTALAVVRNAAKLGLRPVICDSAAGIALSTRRAERELWAKVDEARWLERLVARAAVEPTWLIATSDAWLRFIVRHRAALESSFGAILHPRDAALAVCLEKARFSEWCAAQGLPAPRSYAAAVAADDPGALDYPVLLRPGESAHASPGSVPKAVEAHDARELRHWLDVFTSARVTPLVTESLLGRRLTQYSVGASRRNNEMITFVAVKRRPLPEDCAVGTYVELCPDDAVESLARRALESLDYQGIAEVEILRDEATGRDYLIEINARPWIQYGLGPASGHDLLAFQLDPRRFDRTRAVTRGKRWLNFPNDLFYCFSRSVGVVRQGRVPVGSYLRSMLGANTFAHFAWTDPLPAWRSLTTLARRDAATEDPPHAN